MAVQNKPSKRGRPRGYDPDAALTQAMAAFWDAGYAATTLDAIRTRDRNEPAEPVRGIR